MSKGEKNSGSRRCIAKIETCSTPLETKNANSSAVITLQSYLRRKKKKKHKHIACPFLRSTKSTRPTDLNEPRIAHSFFFSFYRCYLYSFR